MIQSKSFSILFCGSLPLNTFLLVPAIEGTLLPYMLGLVTLPLALLGLAGLRPDAWNSYLKTLVCFAGFWFFFFCASQLGNYLGTLQSFEYLNLIKPEIPGILFRKTLFTQSLYFLACISIFLYFKYILPKEHIKYLTNCCWVFLVYGFYEWVFYLLFGYSGDFIANRKMQDADLGGWTGSWLQTYNAFGFNIMRFKSTFGEPSFFSLACVPFLFVYLLERKYIITFLLLLSALLSISTSAYLGILAGLLSLLFLRPRPTRQTFTLLVFTLVFLGLGITLMLLEPEVMNSMFFDKFSGQTDSGARRFELTYYFDRAYSSLTVWQKTFGIGQGYSYSSVFLANLVNFGFLGTLMFFLFFLAPLCRNLNNFNPWHFSCLISLFLMVLNVAEFYQPVTWALLGMAWRDDL